MPLPAGTHLGPYEILAPIGAGGMGEVYRARDPRLGRDVAIKVSAERFSERFEREERVIASLNHPNICQLYDVGPNFLVMELVEGPTLAERLKSGPVPLEEALDLARQIADALEAAHEKGITHRDLKPGNIKVKADGTVKVLDFGLAKMGVAPSTQSVDSPTMTMGQTQAGMILGTAAYMSPEQAKGKPVDPRSDIYAFGSVLYEMVTGKRLHDGDSTTEVLASVIKEEPKWSSVPPQIEKLLRRCLAKDPQKRLKHIGDAMLLVESALVESAQAAPAAAARHSEDAHHAWLWPGVAILAVLGLAPLNVVHLREHPPAVEPIRFQVPPPPKGGFGIYLAISPDGKRLAFTGTGADGATRIWVRDLDSIEARPLSGTEEAQSLFWSPDSRYLAFGLGQELKKIDVTGGPPQTLCQSAHPVGSGSWSKSGVIVFGGRGSGPLQQVPEAGGTPTAITELGQAVYHSFPFFLPDGRHFLYFRNSTIDTTGIYLGELGVKPSEQSPKRVVQSLFNGVYAPDPGGGAGRVLFMREGTLMAQPFDTDHLEFTGEAAPIAEGVGNTNQYANISASANGVLVYRAGGGGNVQLTWLDRDGKPAGQVGEAGPYVALAVSPDGTRAAVRRGGTGDLWLMEFARGVSTRFTFGQGVSDDPVWSPDGTQIAFRNNRNGRFDLYRKASNGAGEEELLLKTDQDKTPASWTKDGRFLIYDSIDPKTNYDIWALPMQGDREPVPVLRTPSTEAAGVVSPDGRWLAYLSSESSNAELYVRPFAPAGDTSAAGKWQVSNAGAFTDLPFWRGDGKELFYRSPAGALMGVDVNTNGNFQAGVPHHLFDGSGLLVSAPADGKRFLAGLPQLDAGPQAITVVLNWQAGLKK